MEKTLVGGLEMKILVPPHVYKLAVSVYGSIWAKAHLLKSQPVKEILEK